MIMIIDRQRLHQGVVTGPDGKTAGVNPAARERESNVSGGVDLRRMIIDFGVREATECLDFLRGA